MKTNSIIYALLMILGLLPVQGEWIISYKDEIAYLGYNWKASGKKPPSTDGLAEILTNRQKDFPLKQITFFTYFLNDIKIQQELLKEFQSSYPELLADALKSSGNLHNPKIAPLSAKFSECLLKTPTVVRINEQLSATGFTVKKAEYEKFYIIKDQEIPTFYAVVWLTLEAKADPKPQP